MGALAITPGLARAAFGAVVAVVVVTLAYAALCSHRARIDEQRENPWAAAAQGRLGWVSERVGKAFSGTGTHLTAQELTTVWAALVFLPPLTVIALGQALPLALGAAAFGGVAPLAWARSARARARRAFEENLGQALPLVASNLRGGLAFRSAIVPVGQNMAEPLKTEFALLSQDLDQGTPVEEALARMAARNESKDVLLLASAVMAQRDTGGNLADVIDSVAWAVRSRVELRNMVQSRTSQARTSAKILCALPMLLVVVMCAMQESFREYYLSAMGVATVAGILVLIAVGYAVMAKMADLRAD